VSAVDVGNVNAAGQGGDPPVVDPMPPFFFALEILYLLALAFLVVLSQQWGKATSLDYASLVHVGEPTGRTFERGGP
jgi:hypothetical protein